MSVRWRPPRIGLFLLGAWLVGSIVISLILRGEMQGFRYAAVVLGVWALLFLGFTYVVLALAFNSTNVRVEMGKLVVRNGPLPFGGSSSTDVGEIEDVFVSSYQTPGARGMTGGKAYSVVARTRTSGTIPVVVNSALDSDEAEEIAKRITLSVANAVEGARSS